MKRLIIVLFVSLVVVGIADATMPPQYMFPDAVAEAKVILRGTISGNGSKPVLNVEETLKGEYPGQITLRSEGMMGIEPAEFVDGEKVIVFLKSVDNNGVGTLIGVGCQGKWPQPPGSWAYQQKKTYQTDDLDRIERAVIAVDAMLSTRDFEAQSRRAVNLVRSEDEVLQLAGLELSMCVPLIQSLPVNDRGSLRRRVATVALDRLRSKNPDVRTAAADDTYDAPASVAAPALIDMIADPDRRCRRTAHTSLDCAFTNRVPIPIELQTLRFQSDRGDLEPTPEELAAAESACRRAWASVRDEQLKRELPRLREQANSSSPLEKECALIYLNRLGVPPPDNSQ
jgi:hypothetical protein